MKRLRHVVCTAPRVHPRFKLKPDLPVSFAPMDALRDGLGGLSELETRSFSEVVGGSYNYFEDGDILLAKVTPCFENGKKAIAEELESGAGFATSEVLVIRPNNEAIETRYLRYVFCSEDFRHSAIASMTGAGGLRRISERAVLGYRIRISDLATQRQIADFLDRETARIDLLIEKKQRLVALLGENLQAKISSLVKGTSPSNTIRLRHVVRLNPSARRLRLGADSLVTFCPMEAIQDGVGGIDVSYTRPLSEVASASYNFFAEGDILLAKVTPCFENGKKALARNLHNGIGFATSEVFVVRPNRFRVYPEYLVYLFSSDDFQYAGRSSMTGAGGLRRISERSILTFPLFVLDRQKQKEIVENIDVEVSRSEMISEKTNVSIDRLKEYRSALITAAVTGQIDVQTYARAGTTDRRLDAIQTEMGV